MRYTEENKKSNIKISKLTAELLRTISEFMKTNEISYHELQAVYIRLMESTNNYALSHELREGDNENR